MSLNSNTFESIVPTRYITFRFPNPLPHPFPPSLHTPLLHISVVDSPFPSPAAKTAAILVPTNRQSDWIFSTENGLLQLIVASAGISRLILIASDYSNCPQPTFYGSPPDATTIDSSKVEQRLVPLLRALTPKSVFDQNNGFPEIPFLCYEDEVNRNVVLEVCTGSCVGEMQIENVELKLREKGREFRRRLRFKRMPNLIQTQMRIYPMNDLKEMADNLQGVEFVVDNKVLVQPYLSPMVAGLSAISSYLDGRIRSGFRPKAMCLGVGGGALVSFLSAQLGFEVVGVEQDKVVLSVARKYFGLDSSELVRIYDGDGIELIQKFAFGGRDGISNGCSLDGKFDAIMVDFDGTDAKIGSNAPPIEFVNNSVLLASAEVLSEHGLLILNVIPPNKSFYEMVVSEFEQVFQELYEIDVGNEENLVLVASASQIQAAADDQDNNFLQKLKESIQESYIGSMRKISRPAGH